MALEIPRHRFTAHEFEQMGIAGIFDEDDRLELLDGDIVEMSPLGPRHVSTINRLNMLLAPRLVGEAIVSVQNSLRLEPHWEPVPDIAILRLREDEYRARLINVAKQERVRNYLASLRKSAKVVDNREKVLRTTQPTPGA